MSAEVHSFIADSIHQQKLVDQDGFALAASRALEDLAKWNKSSITAAIGSVETDLFWRHIGTPKNVILNHLAETLLKRWPSNPQNAVTKKQSALVKILFIAANPTDIVAFDPKGAPVVHKPLGLDHEFRAIQQKLRASEHRDLFQLVSRWAARPDDLLQAFNEERPQIVHFSGHGTDTNELVLLDDRGNAKIVSKNAIESLFKTMKDQIRLVVLNACFSKEQAAVITKHIDSAIGMKIAIGDEAAITFAAAFYRAIGFGHSVKDSFEQGLTALKLEGIAEDKTPILMSRKGTNPQMITLIQ
jgi:hypothetical protein